MRKLFNIFLFVLCIVAIAGCNDTESSEFKLEIKAVNTNFQATGGKGYIQLQSTGNITADVDVDWCVLKEVNPNEVVFEVKENSTPDCAPNPTLSPILACPAIPT